MKKKPKACHFCDDNFVVLGPSPCQPFIEFFRMCLDSWIDSDCLSFLDGSDFQEWGEKVGLLVQVAYDREKHGEIDDAEPGDMIYVLSDKAKAALGVKEKP